MGSGVTANFGTMTKPLHVGLAARNGVLSARLAQSGFTANRQVLEAKNGFFDSYYQTGKPDIRVFDDLATRYALQQYGVRFKPYPCGGLTHSAIYATIRLREEHMITPGSVDHVAVAVPADTAEPLVYRVPKNGLEGKFSMPYLIARALTDGNVSLDAFTDEAVRNEAVRQLLQRVDMTVDPGLQAGPDGSRPASVSIRLTNGQTLAATEKFPKGSPQVPMTSGELIAKFRACARGVISETACDRAVSLVGTLEAMRSVRPLVTLLA
jgi:2-methylcitrate dehydratase PrpD